MTNASDTVPTGTWTAYPCLLTSLSQEHQYALEEAVCADHCHRYPDADAIFASRLPPSHTIPILALQHADMLSSSGREHERIKLLQESLVTLDFKKESAHPCLEILLKVMLADALFYALGQLPDRENLLVLRILRVQLRGRSLESLSDVEIRCISAYYEFVSLMATNSNYIGKTDRTIFEDGSRAKRFDSKVDELQAVLKVLKDQRRWRFAPTLMQLVLKHTPDGLAMRDPVNEAIAMCAVLEAQPHPGVKFRAVIVKRTVAGIIADMAPPWAASLTQEYIQVVEAITPPSFSQWQDFCPFIAGSAKKTAALDATNSEDEQVKQLTVLAQEAESRKDFVTANQLWMSTRDVAKRWLYELNDGDGVQPAVMKRFICIQEAYLTYHRERTRTNYFYAAAILDYLTTLFIRLRNCTKMLTIIDGFLAAYPDFSVPQLLERVYSHGANAARALDLEERCEQLSTKHTEWMSKCSFWEAGGNGLSGDAVLDPDYARRQIHFGDHDMIAWGTNALRVMLIWAAHEWNTGLLKMDEVQEIFGPGLGELPKGNVAEYLKDVPAHHLADTIFGTRENPRGTPAFLEHFKKVQQWLLLPDRLPDRSTRLFAASVVLQSRGQRSFEGREEYSLEQQRLDQEAEHAQLNEIRALQSEGDKEEAAQLDTRVSSSKIHNTLLRSFLANPVARGLITDAELKTRIVECRQLIERYRHRGQLFYIYHGNAKLMRLVWQRHIHFSECPEDVLPIAEEADKIFTKIRSGILMKDPSADLVARVKLSKDFEYREHYNYALRGSLKAAEKYGQLVMAPGDKASPVKMIAERKMHENYFAFLSWALRSKGPGFADILNLESGIAQSMRDNDDAISTAKALPVVSLENQAEQNVEDVREGIEAVDISSPAQANPFGGTTATMAQVNAMLETLPDGVVVVDFTDIKYAMAPATKIVAIIHRKGRRPFIHRVPEHGLDSISTWVEEHLDEPQKRGVDPLTGPDAMKPLEELSGLFNGLVGASGLIAPGDTIVICPTGSLNRIPMHAIPVGDGVDKKLLIERNPVIYCQSLTILYWLWLRFKNSSEAGTNASPKATVINPMPETWESGAQVMSSDRNQALAQRLGCKEPLHGFGLERESVKNSIQGSSLFHYHGHVAYNPNAALDSIMAFNQAALTSPFRRAGEEASQRKAMAARELFNMKLQAPALATIIGCGSGMTAVSSTDDVLGFPTALFYAGAGAVVSTLWPLDDEDGVQFSVGLYEALGRQQRDSTGDGCFLRGNLDMALAMQKAVNGLRMDPARSGLLDPYHWAAFTVNGFWLLPRQSLPEIELLDSGL